MWRNTDVAEFIGWLRDHNEKQEASQRSGFYGLDIYNMSGSIEAVLAYLGEVDPEAAAAARERYGCLTPWQKEPSTYGRAVLTAGYKKCEQAVIAQCRELLRKQLDYEKDDPDNFVDAAQNARLIASAERYYRIMYYGGAESWNLRDTHMFETLEHILDARGPDSKAVVWAHNSHIGDARHTEMGSLRDELNIGQLCRQRFGDRCRPYRLWHSFGHCCRRIRLGRRNGDQTGSALAPRKLRTGVHDSGEERFLLDFSRDEALRRRLTDPRLERFIGVIYRPGHRASQPLRQCIAPAAV